ncbi:hypothetical protein NIES37_69560 (plasmid) [Tolypothrix tenuis PCC 7101]|uniref:Uncharacterized protein n=1 Tax=Tolypothrix tenuis PCC 7101 TaxID=231146 RepID=A0A1Z4NB38_9CYAN|nr:hypothetical protein [Aulosira sp. FACHB-113]BAZ02943.1 hypothetical protein NIES37_69560 [Tolypothrix tenuis PCC 7101]BAZ78134.1 hypothetical protein NIES50_67670 [Aulosira laxa NIES-50]
MTIKEYAESIGIKPGKLVDEFRKNFPGQTWTINSQLPEEFLAAHSKVKQDQHQQQATQPFNGMGEATITKADEAIQQASYKLTAADKQTISGAIAVQNEQSKILGASTGVTGALLFMESLIAAKGTVLDAFAEQSLLEVDNQIAEIDQSLINLAEEASTRLGESIRNKEQLKQRLNSLRHRVSSMGTQIQF